MAFLQDLSVKKVSFVNRAANKRKFLLLKSDDHGDQKIEKEQEHEEESTMKDEIRKSVRLLLKSGNSDEKIVETLKTEYKLDDAELAEVKGSIEFARSMIEAPPVKKEDPIPVPAVKADAPIGVTKEDLDAIRKENADLRGELQKSAETTRKKEIKIWLNDNCAYVPGDAAKLTDDIFKMEKADPEAAERYKESLKQSSDLVKNSTILGERGSNYDAAPTPAGEMLLQKAKEAVSEIRKSGDPKLKDSDAIIAAVKSVPGAFVRYREEHIRRARLMG